MSESMESTQSLLDTKVQGVLAQVQHLTDQVLATVESPRILEAGCGCFTRMRPQPTWQFIGIDISQDQLDNNTYLSEKILGDVQTYPLPKESFHMIAGWWLLEHLPTPQLALNNFVQALAPGGILLLAFPNVLSFKGMVTKLSPHWFHVWVFRRIFRESPAETDGHNLFPTYMRLAMSPRRIRQFAHNNALSVELFETWESSYQSRLHSKSWIRRRLWRFLWLLFRMASLGRIDISQTDCVCVLKKAK